MQRLVGALVQVDDREPAKRETDRVVVPDALAVGTALAHRGGHPLEKRRVGAAACRPADTAHAVEDTGGLFRVCVAQPGGELQRVVPPLDERAAASAELGQFGARPR